ncbi:Phage-related protein (plasmid) [Zymomonas mobilis subsp. mobilis str. CP4 = NRRL B-14023]|uniref:phage tail tape measure protein n=1 Tax=Zymomonas mobilis TaxID=542 RepID=UPI0003C74182|nr:phage tail tape measure protein [Zymomonas mobilis]AHB11060.1 Phage-related minor tail protein [Zymomonas mobilis subsp. mobilis str. CP4 = NRRL B-14023]AHJ71427.1 Phage-related protein [Zymomonas mobilis subsp. mobilis NRRL B-12526]AHJ73267.1 Phage-related protein [Zymomonas mobilis subsp. mobilis str. CP4 = NRRL B-14023]
MVARVASNELKLKIILEAFDKVTTPLERIRKSGIKTSKAFQDTQKALNALKRAQSATEAFQRTQDQIEKTKKRFDQYKEKLKETQAAIDGTKNPTDKQVKKLHELAAIVGNMPDKLKAQNEKLDQLKSKLQSAGGSTDHLGQYQDKLKNHIEKTNHALEREAAHIERVEHTTKRLVAIRDKAAKFGSLETIMSGAAAAAPALVVARSAIEHEDSMAEISKVAKMTAAQKADIDAALKTMANNGPATYAELAESAATAARQSIGIKQNADGTATIDTAQLMHFTDKSNKAAVALGMDREGTGAMIGHMRNNDYSEKQIDTTLDQMSVIANKFGGHGEYIREVFAKNLPIIKNANMSASDLAVLGNLNDTAGLQADEASTGIKHMLNALTVGDKGATKRQQLYFKDTGKTAGQWQKLMQEQGGGETILQFLEQVKKMPVIKRSALLNGIFGKEGASSVATMANESDHFKQQRAAVNDPNMLKNDGVENENKIRAATTANQLKMLKNNFDTLAADVGTQLLPQIQALAAKLIEISRNVDNFALHHKTLIKNLGKTAMVVGPAIVAMAGLGFAIRTVASTGIGLYKTFQFFRKLKDASFLVKMIEHFGKAGKGVKKLFGLFKLFKKINFASTIISGIQLIVRAISAAGALLAANPVILAISAIVIAIAGAAYLIYQNWDSIKKYTAEGLSAIKQAWSSVSQFFSGLWNDFKEMGGHVIHGLVDGITSAGSAVKEAVTNMGSNVIGWFKEKLGIHSPSRVFHSLGGFIVDGLNNGISDNAHHPINHIRNLAEQVSSAFRPDLSGLALSSHSPRIITKSVFEEARGSGSNQPKNTRPISQIFHFTINAAPNQSPMDIGHSVQKIAQDAIRAPQYSDTPDWVY